MAQRRGLWVYGLALALVSLLIGGLRPAPAARAAASPAEGEFVYALEDNGTGSNRIFGYRLDGVSGRFIPLPGFPLSTGGAGDGGETFFPVQRLAYHAATRRLFALEDGSNNLVRAYAVNTSSGALSPLYTISLGAGAWMCLAVHPSGSPLLAGGFQNGVGRVASYTLSDAAATPAVGSPFSIGVAGDALPYSCAFSQSGAAFYAGGWGPNQFAGFAVQAGSSVLSPLPGSPFDAGLAYPGAYATDGAGRLLMAQADGDLNGTNPQRIQVFTTSAGVPTAVGAPVPSGLLQPLAGIWHPAGFYMVAGGYGDKIGIYRISGSGAQTQLSPISGSPVPTASGATGLTLSRSGAMLVAADAGDGVLQAFAVNTGTGDLQTLWVPTRRMISGYISGVVAASAPPPAAIGGYVYGLRDSAGGNQIYGFGVNAATGELSALPGFPVPTGGAGGDVVPELTYLTSRRMAVDPVNSRLYVINNTSNTVSAFAIDPADGGLTPLPFSPIALPEAGPGWFCLDVHPSGSPLVIGGEAAIAPFGLTASYRISAGAATAAPGSPYRIGGSSPFTCAFSQDGANFYGAGNDIISYAVDAGSGALSLVGGSPFSTDGLLGAYGLATDTSGRIFIADGGSSGSIPNIELRWEAYAFTSSGGVPSGVGGNPFNSDVAVAIDGVWHPAGYYLIATSAAVFNDQIAVERREAAVSVLKVNGSGGGTTLNLVPGSPFPAGTYQLGSGEDGARGTQAITIDHTGRLVLTINAADRSIYSFGFDPADGALQGISRLPTGALGAGAALSGIGYTPALADLAPELRARTASGDGLQVQYTIRVQNHGRPTARAEGPITLTAQLPAGVSFQSGSGGGWSCGANGRQLTCNTSAGLSGGAALPDLQLRLTLSPAAGDTTLLLAVAAAGGEVATGNNQLRISGVSASDRIYLPLLRR